MTKSCANHDASTVPIVPVYAASHSRTLGKQVRWAKWSLERVQVKAGRGEAGRPLEPGDVLAHQLSHFVNTLHQFVMDRLLHGAWLELEQVGPIITVATQMFLQLSTLVCRPARPARTDLPVYLQVALLCKYHQDKLRFWRIRTSAKVSACSSTQS